MKSGTASVWLLQLLLIAATIWFMQQVLDHLVHNALTLLFYARAGAPATDHPRREPAS